MTVGAAAWELVRNPRRVLFERWNWKSALFSSSFRAMLFLCANLRAGWRAAAGAMMAEFLYRAATSGFYGAITQAFSEAEPEWAATAASAVLLPLVSHSIELALHLMRGTPKIITSIIASVCFTVVSTMFNAYAMRRGTLIVGSGGGSIVSDLRRVPALLVGFLTAGAIRLNRDNDPITVQSNEAL